MDATKIDLHLWPPLEHLFFLRKIRAEVNLARLDIHTSDSRVMGDTTRTIIPMSLRGASVTKQSLLDEFLQATLQI